MIYIYNILQGVPFDPGTQNYKLRLDGYHRYCHLDGDSVLMVVRVYTLASETLSWTGIIYKTDCNPRRHNYHHQKC